MLEIPQRSRLRIKLLSWPTAAAVVVLIQAVLSLGFKPSQTLSALTLIPYFLLLAIATGAAATNAVQKTLERRTFWVFLAIGLGLWTLDQWFWVYLQVGWQIKSTDSPIGAPLLFLHVVFFLAALATRPDLGQPSRSQHLTTLNLLLILFFWTFLYAYFVLSCQFLGADSKLYNLRFHALYFTENFALIGVLAILIFRTQQPWKAVYWHMFGAASIYAIGSLAANLSIDFGGYYPGHWSDFVIIVSICWFVWVPLNARMLTAPSAPLRETVAASLQTTSTLAMFAVLAIPLLGAWELYQGDSARMQRVRLLEVLGFMLLLALAVFIKWYFEYRELKQVGILSDDMRRKSEERFRELVQSVDAIVWDANAKDLHVSFVSQGVEKILGYSPGEWMKTPDFWANHLHPEDRIRALACEHEALAKGKPLSGEYRMMSADGRVVWFRDFIHPVLGADGKTERLRGVMLDITESKDAEEGLRHSEDRYRDLVEHSHDLICTHDLKGKLLSVNPEPAKILGYTPAELLDTDMRSILAPEVRGKFDEYLANVSRDGMAQGLMTVLTRSGERRIWEYRNTLRTEGVQEPVVRGMACDVTERKEAEAQLRQSEERFRLIAENIADLIAVLDLEGKRLYNSPSYKEILGDPVALRGSVSFDEIHPDDRERIREIFQETVRTGRGQRAEYRFLVKDGSVRYIESQGSVIRDEKGKCAKVLVVSRDVTERKRAQEEIREQKNKAQMYFDIAGVMLLVLNPNQEVALINLKGCEILGYEREEIIGKHWCDNFVPARERDRISLAFAKVMVGGIETVAYVENPVLTKTGKERLIAWHNAVLRDEAGKIVNSLSSGQDITERKRAEDELRRSEAYLAVGQRLSHTGSWAMNVSSGELFWSQETYRIFGFDPATTKASINETFLPRIHAEDRPIIEEGLKAAVIQKGSYEVDYRIVLPDGSIKYIHGVVYPVISEAGVVAERYGVIMDVTERKRAEEALFAERHLLRTLMDNLPDPIYFKDHESRFTRINKSLAKAFGLGNPAQAVGRTDLDFFADEHAQKAFADEQEIIRTGQPLLAEEEKETWPDGHVTWASTTKMPLRDANGNITGTFGISRDITERKRAEEALHGSRDQLRALAARLQDIREEERTRVARELHDQLGQELTAIKIGVSTLIDDLPEDKKPQGEPIKKFADGTIQTVRRISTELRPPILDDSGLVATVEWAAHEFAYRTGTRCHLDMLDENIVINQDQATALFRIFQETLSNVLRHANATEIKVRLAREDSNLVLEVHDNGKGISIEQVSDKGSLGILGMKERAMVFGGEVMINGAPGRGTTVSVRIPEKHTRQQELFK